MIWGSERWDITCRPNEMGIIENGYLAGETFDEYFAKSPVAVLGKRFANSKRFPLLIKIIDAKDTLSVQVHPDDVYAMSKGETDSGKSEMWYILNPPDDGHLIVGLKSGVTHEILAEAYRNGTVEDCLNRLHVKAGDIVNIPAGLVHALTPGVVVAEIQQNSDITYRLHDYNRLSSNGQPRQLHVADALCVIDFDERIPKTIVPSQGISGTKEGTNELILVISTEYFTVHKYVIIEPLIQVSNPDAFAVFTCIENEAIIETDTTTVEISKQRSVFIPATLGEYIIRPKGESVVLLKSEPMALL